MSKVDKFSPYHDGSMQFDIDGGWVSYDDYKESADRIEELEAKLSKSEALLAKATEALCLADAALSGANMNMRVVEKSIKSTLAELKGEK